MKIKYEVNLSEITKKKMLNWYNIFISHNFKRFLCIFIFYKQSGFISWEILFHYKMHYAFIFLKSAHDSRILLESIMQKVKWIKWEEKKNHYNMRDDPHFITCFFFFFKSFCFCLLFIFLYKIPLLFIFII